MICFKTLTVSGNKLSAVFHHLLKISIRSSTRKLTHKANNASIRNSICLHEHRKKHALITQSYVVCATRLMCRHIGEAYLSAVKKARAWLLDMLQPQLQLKAVQLKSVTIPSRFCAVCCVHQNLFEHDVCMCTFSLMAWCFVDSLRIIGHNNFFFSTSACSVKDYRDK